ncbi:LysR family transcriptional regulator [Flavobacterium sp. DG1-102-2]|uniref:LysR family transcriptional regulator n=1 Tax=Flavobacterium sp. DG1-102-2 TaxID=3081663 RepID=UPI002948F403|nr:LysR family transcriptional regulator [Flavobacterium sp. DG1-102-2]MDV6170335.1 LysR family transcriptional regulator [Flavobacterium sp. DG1-102-2]
MNSNDLKIFETVAVTANFTKAAEMMYTVQSNVTSRIKNLEQEFNAVFFKRTSRSVELTEQGKLFLQYCRSITLLTEEIKNELQNDKEISGNLKIGCIETTMALKIPGLINHFTDLYPKINLSFKADNSTNLINDVLTYKLDAAFVVAPVIMPELDTVKVNVERLVLVTSKAYNNLKSHLKKDTVKIVVFDQGCSYRARLEVWLKTNGILNYQYTIINTLEGMINFVEAGIGITLLPEDVINKLYYNRNINSFTVKGELGLMTTVIVSRNDIPKSNALKIFTEMFK